MYENAVAPIFFSQSSIFHIFRGEDEARYGLLHPNYSNITYKTYSDEELKTFFSLSTFTPEYRCNPLTLLCYVINVDTKKRLKCRIVFDHCSNLTCIKRSLAEALGLEGQKCDIPFISTGGNIQRYSGEKEVRFLLASVKGNFVTDVIQAVTLPTVTQGMERVLVDPADYSYLNGIEEHLTEVLPMSQKHYKKYSEISILITAI